MDAINPNSILHFNENHLANVRKAVGYEDVNRLKQDIEQFEDWIQKQNHFRVKEFGREYVERLLIYNKGSIERAKKKFDKLLTCTNLMPEFLQNFDIRNEFVYAFNILDICLLPKPSDDNYRIVLIVNNGKADENYEVVQFYRYMIVMSHYLLMHDYCQGFEVVADMTKINMGVIKKLGPVMIAKGLMVVMECLGQRMKKIHLFSSFKLFEVVFNILKIGLSSKVKERIIFHPTVDTLYEHIPREQLPKDYGGDEKSLKELTELNFKEFSSDEHIARVKFMSEAGTDESRRMACTFNEEYSGVPGSFKTLCVD
ncbi:alpha-tocopherol transfer protein-like [Anticarsia gemmatalis]|uniref:alpha-tocopherol transfer protein-like n=1 Tax=Anticarsia gemmatalis TaxID=129554 RepID=UPI003F77777C